MNQLRQSSASDRRKFVAANLLREKVQNASKEVIQAFFDCLSVDNVTAELRAMMEKYKTTLNLPEQIYNHFAEVRRDTATSSNEREAEATDMLPMESMLCTGMNGFNPHRQGA